MACHPVQVRLQQSLAAGPEQLSLYEQAALQCDAEVAAMSEEERRTALNVVLQQQVSAALKVDHCWRRSTDVHRTQKKEHKVSRCSSSRLHRADDSTSSG